MKSVRVYYIDVSTVEYSERLLVGISDKRVKAADAFNDSTNKKLKLGVEWILNRIAAERGISLPLDYIFGSNGKPAIDGFPFYFSASHSGFIVICAVCDNEPIGIDIELSNRNLSSIAIRRRMLSEVERVSPGIVLTDVWTAKEAFLKMTGDGLTGKFDMHELTLKDGRIVGENVPDNIITRINDIPDYTVALCTSSICEVSVERINM